MQIVAGLRSCQATTTTTTNYAIFRDEGTSSKLISRAHTHTHTDNTCNTQRKRVYI